LLIVTLFHVHILLFSNLHFIVANTQWIMYSESSIMLLHHSTDKDVLWLHVWHMTV